MQSLREIRRILSRYELHVVRRWGQNFLIDLNLMGKLLELADLGGDETVLEVGAGTGSLTEELLERAKRVVAVEIDRGLIRVLRDRLGQRDDLALVAGDVLAAKHALAPEVLGALGPRAVLVANLPYNVATPLVAECLISSWRHARTDASAGACRFDRLSFTAQREVAERLSAVVGERQYCPLSVLVALLGRLKLGPVVPASAFWPRPKVAGRIVRIDLDPAADRLKGISHLRKVLSLAFGQRRKQIGSIIRRKDPSIAADVFLRGLESAMIDPTLRPGEVTLQQYLRLANELAPAPNGCARGDPSSLAGRS